jgi:hypothetical protein
MKKNILMNWGNYWKFKMVVKIKTIPYFQYKMLDTN